MSNLHTKAMLVSLSIRQWTARKYDRSVSRKVEQDYNAHDAGRFNKLLIAQEEMKKIQKIANEARIFHYENTLPWGDNGTRILPTKNYFEYVESIKEIRNKFVETVNTFIDVYPELKEEARRRLNGMFKEMDYPTVEELKSRFDFNVGFAPVPDSNDFRVDLNDSEIDKIRKEIDAKRDEAERVAMKELWQRLYNAVEHMVNKLSDSDAVFRDSLVKNVAEICQLLPKLNITNDNKLTEMGNEVAAKLSTIEPDVLRKDKGTRREICGTAEDILNKMKGYIG